MLCLLLFSGCAFVPVSSRLGEQTGKMYQAGYQRGVPAAEKIIKSWPYVSGLIRGTFGIQFELVLSVDLQRTVQALDLLATKPALTDEDKGRIIGNVNRLEYLAGKEFADQYGAAILAQIKALMM